jgi:hypothetical protein
MFATAALFAAVVAVSQSPATSTPTPGQETAPASSGKVIFSRSTDAEGNVTTQTPAAPQTAPEPVATDDERRAVTFTDLSLDVRLQTAVQHIAVRAQVTVRNDGKAPLTHIPLQLSSTLQWEEIRVGGQRASFTVATLNSDADHTGQLHEAAVPLAVPLAPGASLTLDTIYSGLIAPTAQRLISVGTPEDIARHSDWDAISTDFTGLRGFGNVVWYPVSSVPVILGDGSRLFDEIGRQKLRLSGCRFSLRLTTEFPKGQPPTVALINGVQVPLTVTDAQGLDPDLLGVASASLAATTLGFQTPSLFLAVRTAHPGAAAAEEQPNVIAFTTADNQVNVHAWLEAAVAVTPFLNRWLGPRPRTPLVLLDLPDPDDVPWESGSLLCAVLAEPPHDASVNRLTTAVVHALARAYASVAPAWLSEGQATFVEALWIERKQGRDRALTLLESSRSALAMVEPSSPGESAGTPLPQAISPVYYRSKAAYVLWMLRDQVGDDVLIAALSACDAAEPGRCDLPSLLKQNGATADTSWLFSDWVDADKGLPDLSVDGVFPTPAKSDTYLVAVNLTNAGYASAVVPVSVRTDKSTVTERVLVPARGKVTQRILVMAPPTEVQVNDGSVPETQASVHITPVGPAPPPPTQEGPTPHKQPRDKNN